MNKGNGLYSITAICVCMWLLAGCATLGRLLDGRENADPSGQTFSEDHIPSQKKSTPFSSIKGEAGTSSRDAADAESENTKPEENKVDDAMGRFGRGHWPQIWLPRHFSRRNLQRRLCPFWLRMCLAGQ